MAWKVCSTSSLWVSDIWVDVARCAVLTAGGMPGACGQNLLIRKDGRVISLGAKIAVEIAVGDSFRLLTPGGGMFLRSTATSFANSVFFLRRRLRQEDDRLVGRCIICPFHCRKLMFVFDFLSFIDGCMLT